MSKSVLELSIIFCQQKTLTTGGALIEFLMFNCDETLTFDTILTFIRKNTVEPFLG